MSFFPPTSCLELGCEHRGGRETLKCSFPKVPQLLGFLPLHDPLPGLMLKVMGCHSHALYLTSCQQPGPSPFPLQALKKQLPVLQRKSPKP